MRSPIIVWMASLTFLAYIGQYTFVFWFPTMLKRLSGFSDMRVGILGALPFLAGFLAIQFNGWHSDKPAERRWPSAIPLFVAVIAYFFPSIPGHSRLLPSGSSAARNDRSLPARPLRHPKNDTHPGKHSRPTSS